MSVLRLPEPLDAAYTDADWAQDFDLGVQGGDMVGDIFEMVFAGRAGSSALALAGFTLTSQSGALALIAPGVVGIRLSGAEGGPMRQLPPGEYDFMLRRFPIGGGVEPLIEGRVTIIQGLSLRVAGPVVAGGGATFRAQSSAGRIRILRTLSGPMGPGGAAGGLVDARAVEDRLYPLTQADLRSVLAFASPNSVQVHVPRGLGPLFTVILAAQGGGPIYLRADEGVQLVAPAGLLGCSANGGLELLPLGGDRYLVRGGDVVPPAETHPPTALTLAPDVVVAGAPPGTLIGQLLVDDVDPGDAFTFAMADDLDGRFAIAGGALVIGPAGLPGAGDQILTPTIRVTDGDGYVLNDTVAVFVGLAGSLDFRRASQALPLTFMGFA